MPNRLQWWAATHAPWLLALTTALTALALVQLVDLRTGELHLSVDPSLDAVSTATDTERAYADLVRRRFGSTEAVIVVMQVSNVFTADALRGLERLSGKLAALAGVESVTSLSTTPVPHVEDGVLRYLRASGAALADPSLLERLRLSVADNPLVSGQLVSPDGRAAVVFVKLGPQSEREMLRSDLAGRILGAAESENAAGVRIHVTGPPIIRSAISVTVTRQLWRIVPAIVIVITVCLALAFPTLHGALLPIATIVIALVWTFATLSALGRPLNLVTSLVPPLLATMGLAYCAHVLSEFEALGREHDSSSPIAHTAALLSEVSVPVSVTGLTTVAGFLALLLNQQPSMIEFAWLSALGTSYLVVLTLCFVPAVLRYVVPRADTRSLPGSRLFGAVSRRISRFDQRRRPQILIAAGVLFFLALFCASRIRVGDAFVGIFPESSRVRVDYDSVNLAIGGVNPLDIVIDGASADALTDPSAVQALDALQTWLRAQPEVGGVIGFADHVKLMNRYLGGAGANGVPTSRDAVRQMAFVGDGESLRGVVNSDRSSTLIRARLRVDDTASIGALLDRLRPRLDELPAGLESRVTGSAALMTESVRTATAGQLQSVALALALIYLCLSLQFMSLRIGFLVSLPAALQTTLYFGALGLLRVPLNPTTVLVECLVLGLAIDDTIHYLARFSSAAKRSGSEAIAATSALKAVLRPATLTKAILAIGFLTMVSGELRNQALFGWLAALTLSCAWLVDTFVTPAFMSGLRIVTMWDVLRLNIGSDVQKTIPLFAGLTNRQARIFSLMANLHTVPAGTRLMTEGEAAGSIYVVIDGELAVSVRRGDKQLALARLGRGAVVGEHGYFGQKRNANVDALTESRLLRFDHADQERICEAYPAIAARVFLSLNRLQAARQTERLMSEQA